MNTRTRKKLRNRKYGTATHKHLRRAHDPIVQAGYARCAICGEMIPPGPWDLAHDDRAPGLYLGPAHEVCNRGAPHRNVTSVAWS